MNIFLLFPPSNNSNIVHIIIIIIIILLVVSWELTKNANVDRALCSVVLLVPYCTAVRSLVGGALHILHSQGAICNALTYVRWQPHSICANRHTSLKRPCFPTVFVNYISWGVASLRLWNSRWTQCVISYVPLGILERSAAFLFSVAFKSHS